MPRRGRTTRAVSNMPSSTLLEPPTSPSLAKHERGPSSPRTERPPFDAGEDVWAAHFFGAAAFLAVSAARAVVIWSLRSLAWVRSVDSSACRVLIFVESFSSLALSCLEDINPPLEKSVGETVFPRLVIASQGEEVSQG